MPTPPADPTPSLPRSGRVLIVEDHEDAAAWLTALLDAHGFTPLSVAAGTAAYAAVQVFEPDAIILDLGLPGLDGEEVARRVLALPADLRPRILVLTGRSDPDIKDRLLGVGVDAFMVKPADPDELLSWVRRFSGVAT